MSALSTPFVQAIGLALIHFSWQGLLIGSVLSTILAAMRKRSPNERYVVCLATMLLMLVVPIITTGVILFGGTTPLDYAGDHVVALRHGNVAIGWIVPFLPWFTGFWLLGASCLQLRLIMNWIRAQRMRYVGIRLLPEAWQRDLDGLRRRLGVDKPVRIFESSLIDVPSVIGWWQPIVLLPVDIMSTITPPQLRAVIAHELAHVRRHDYLVNLLQNVFESLLFFHPATWWVSDRLRAEREYCCDDMAVAACGSRLDYAKALSSLEDSRGEAREGVLASTGGNLMNRITRMFETRTTTPASGIAWLSPFISLAGVALIAALIAAGCETDGRDDSAIAGSIVGPAVAAGPTVGEEPIYSVPDVDLLPLAARLEECREARILTAEEVQQCLVGLGKMLEARCGPQTESSAGTCRIVVVPSDGAGSACCPDGSPGVRIRTSESWRDCVQRQIEADAAGPSS